MGGPATAFGLGPSPIPVLRPQKPLHMPGGDGHRGKSLKLLEKIPENAEATVVLVGTRGGDWGWGRAGAGAGGHPHWALTHDGRTPAGCVEFLARPTMAFVRLREAVELDAVLEVPVPVRFLFLLLGPSSANMDYHEIGRSISTLMSDKVSRARMPPPPPRPAPSPAPRPWPRILCPHSPWSFLGSNSTRRPTWRTSGRTC